ncbi:unnamed protein product [Nyctereutes procyonoides]|uniref:(raccoon dog) hypothetical protein n=1 Tax=Nyctereutes procyonoides TaxID=34880 RepID=A0A811ZF80_NYCPR|nr:unnamed protein product [Nyctereutes procyonoides]
MGRGRGAEGEGGDLAGGVRVRAPREAVGGRPPRRRESPGWAGTPGLRGRVWALTCGLGVGAWGCGGVRPSTGRERPLQELPRTPHPFPNPTPLWNVGLLTSTSLLALSSEMQFPQRLFYFAGTFFEACSLRSCAIGSRRPVGSEEHLQLVRQGSHKDRLDSSGPLAFSALPSQASQGRNVVFSLILDTISKVKTSTPKQKSSEKG